MSSKMRKFLFISFVVLFFALAAVILPYSFGYKPNFSGWKLQRTGMFDIKTTPSGAAVYLNGRQQTSWLSQLTGQPAAATTPVKLKNITPGTYQVRLELAGYWPWEKQLVVNPSQTTYLEDVYFFKKDQPSLLLAMNAADIKSTAISPDRKNIAVLTGAATATSELRIFSWDKTQAPPVIALPPAASGPLIWSPSGQKIAGNNFIVDWHSNGLTDLKSLGAASIDKLAWADDNTLYFKDKTDIKKIDLSLRQVTATPLSKQNVSDLAFKDGYLYLIRRGSQAALAIIKLSDGEAKEIMAVPLKPSDNYVFVDLGQSSINLQETTSNKLYVISTRLPWFKDYSLTEMPSVTVGQWVNDNKLIFANSFELSLWTSDSQAKLLTRVSYPITALAWHKSNNYIIFATDQTVNSLELDDRSNYNITTLLSAAKIAYPIFNHDGNAIFFWSTINGQSGFYLLEI
jgi:hypothetical protein